LKHEATSTELPELWNLIAPSGFEAQSPVDNFKHNQKSIFDTNVYSNITQKNSPA